MTTEDLQQGAVTDEVSTQAVDESTSSAAVEQVAAPEATADDAAFQAGYDAARSGGELPTEPEPPKLIAGFTEDQVKELLQKAAEVDQLKARESKMFGTLGSLKQAIDAVRNQPQAPQGGPVRISGALKRLSAEFPEMAALLSEDLNEALQGQTQAGGIDQQAFRSELERSSKDMETKLLTMAHKNWRQDVQTPEFAQWKGTLPPDELHIVNDSWDAVSVSAALDKFKEWRSAATQTKQVRQNRLEAAITPKGNRQPAPSMSDEDAFVQGFKSARGIQ